MPSHEFYIQRNIALPDRVAPSGVFSGFDANGNARFLPWGNRRIVAFSSRADALGALALLSEYEDTDGCAFEIVKRGQPKSHGGSGCPNCGHAHAYKHGLTPKTGKQRYRCARCRKTFILEPHGKSGRPRIWLNERERKQHQRLGLKRPVRDRK